ncbi:MAG: prolyl-tRNA synthetase associated domain-containing protein [Gemmatimonadota bacterium]|nr:prolyl-tRNA synthetase associated domain-containing protein [Gemmatimonadota bacterium]
MKDNGPLLIDGGRPRGAGDLFARLDELGIAHNTFDHVPVFTVEEARRLRGRIDGAHSKNLFVRDKKERHWLVSCLSERKVDLKWLALELGTKRLTFCTPRRLAGFLGIRAGAVSPFAILNDTRGVVRVAIDAELLAGEPLNFHPLDNSKTTSISREGLLRFLEAEGHPPKILRFPAAGPVAGT